MMNGVIEIGVFGGCVQWVRGIQKDLEVRVYDYDIDGLDTGRIDTDGEGNRCVTAIYNADDNGDSSVPQRLVP